MYNILYTSCTLIVRGAQCVIWILFERIVVFRLGAIIQNTAVCDQRSYKLNNWYTFSRIGETWNYVYAAWIQIVCFLFFIFKKKLGTFIAIRHIHGFMSFPVREKMYKVFSWIYFMQYKLKAYTITYIYVE